MAWSGRGMEWAGMAIITMSIITIIIGSSESAGRNITISFSTGVL